jgi:hypothetical protein
VALATQPHAVTPPPVQCGSNARPPAPISTAVGDVETVIFYQVSAHNNAACWARAATSILFDNGDLRNLVTEHITTNAISQLGYSTTLWKQASAS